MFQIEVVRLCALWETADIAKENIPTVIELIDDNEIIEQLGDESLQYWNGDNTPIGNPSTDADVAALEREAIADWMNVAATRFLEIPSSPRAERSSMSMCDCDKEFVNRA